MQNSHLLSLFQLTDPTLPIGGFSHSAGLETYVQYGIVHDRQTAELFIREQLSRNIRFTDAALVSLSWSAAADNEVGSLLQLDEECTAVKLPRELRSASGKLGLRLLKVFRTLCPHPLVEAFREAITKGIATGHYPVSFGLLAWVLGIPKEEALHGFYYTTATAMVTNCVKLVPLGQGEGQELLFSLQETIRELVQLSLHPDRDLLGLCCAGFDIRSMQHEQLYSRLYMS
jgi:urease accessory protein